MYDTNRFEFTNVNILTKKSGFLKLYTKRYKKFKSIKKFQNILRKVLYLFDKQKMVIIQKLECAWKIKTLFQIMLITEFEEFFKNVNLRTIIRQKSS